MQMPFVGFRILIMYDKSCIVKSDTFRYDKDLFDENRLVCSFYEYWCICDIMLLGVWAIYCTLECSSMKNAVPWDPFY